MINFRIKVPRIVTPNLETKQEMLLKSVNCLDIKYQWFSIDYQIYLLLKAMALKPMEIYML